MFLLVSIRHVGAHPGEHQHGVSIQISISLGKTFLRISRIRNIPLTWILARVFVYAPTFISQILYFIYWTVLILIYYLFLMAWYWKPAIAVLGQPFTTWQHVFFFFFYSLSSTKSVLYLLPFNCRIYIYIIWDTSLYLPCLLTAIQCARSTLFSIFSTLSLHLFTTGESRCVEVINKHNLGLQGQDLLVVDVGLTWGESVLSLQSNIRTAYILSRHGELMYGRKPRLPGQ